MIKALLTATALMFGTTANAQVLASSETRPFEARLLGAGPQSDQSQLAGILVELAPGWKTYWRVPGPGGIPPRFDWSRSRNLKSVSYVWPAPKIIEAYGTVTLGFERFMLLPVILHAHDPARPIEARVDMEFGVCSDMCVPADAQLSKQLFEANERAAKAIQAQVKKRAKTEREAGLVSATCTITPKPDDEFLLEAELAFGTARQGRQMLVVETGNENLWVSEMDTNVSGRRVSSQADLVNFADGPLALIRDDLRLTLIDASGAVDIRGCPAG